MYHDLQWHTLTSLPRAGVSGAEVHYYTGTKINPKTIGLTFSAGAITLTLANYFFGFNPLTATLTLSAVALTFSLFQFLKKSDDASK